MEADTHHDDDWHARARAVRTGDDTEHTAAGHPLLGLPDELIQHVAGELPLEDRGRFAQASRATLAFAASQPAGTPLAEIHGLRDRDGVQPYRTIYSQSELNASLDDPAELRFAPGTSPEPLVIDREPASGGMIHLYGGTDHHPLHSITNSSITVHPGAVITNVDDVNCFVHAGGTVVNLTGGALNSDGGTIGTIDDPDGEVHDFHSRSTIQELHDGTVTLNEFSRCDTMYGGTINASDDSSIGTVVAGAVALDDTSHIGTVQGGDIDVYSTTPVDVVTGGLVNLFGGAEIKAVRGGTVNVNGAAVIHWATGGTIGLGSAGGVLHLAEGDATVHAGPGSTVTLQGSAAVHAYEGSSITAHGGTVHLYSPNVHLTHDGATIIRMY
ncbi:hypothetical protein AB0N09_43240 [Streptomyces erythrochromogenes]|uniref:hypothetical protein n=1 Tax=Streptomyces erythrochromogenes TaxID=285574 RepID=UPI003430A139